MSERLCKNCEFWDAEDLDCAYAACRRNPPEVGTFDKKAFFLTASELAHDKCNWGDWPLTAPNDWCGEFRPRPGEEGASHE